MGLLMAGLAAAAVAMPAPPAAVSADAVAMVGETPITRAVYDHWLPAAGNPAATMDLLLSIAWLRGEAALHGVAPTAAQLERAYQQELRQSFPEDGDLERYLADAKQTEADLRELSELNVLRDRLVARVHAGVRPTTTLQAERFLVAHRRRFREPARRYVDFVATRDRASALAARAALEAGASFSDVARRWSMFPRRSRDYLSPGASEAGQFDRAVFRARRGVLVGPVRSGGAFHVFRVVRDRPARDQRFSEVRPTIVQLLDERARQRALNRYQRRYEARWKAVTRCAPEFAAVDACRRP